MSKASTDRIQVTGQATITFLFNQLLTLPLDQRQLLELAKAPGNDQCADCQSRNVSSPALDLFSTNDSSHTSDCSIAAPMGQLGSRGVLVRAMRRAAPAGEGWAPELVMSAPRSLTTALQQMGTHVSKVKSLTHDNWTREQVDVRQPSWSVAASRS